MKKLHPRWPSQNAGKDPIHFQMTQVLWMSHEIQCSVVCHEMITHRFGILIKFDENAS